MKRTLEACSWRLIAYTGGCAVNDREGLLQIPTLLLIKIGMVATSPSLGLLPVNLFRTRRNPVISVEIRARLAKVWEMML